MLNDNWYYIYKKYLRDMEKAADEIIDYKDLKKEEQKTQTLSDIWDEIDKQEEMTKEQEKEFCDTIDDIWDEIDKQEKIRESEIIDTIDILHPDEECTCDFQLAARGYDSDSLVNNMEKLGIGVGDTPETINKIRSLIEEAIILRAKFLTETTIFQVSVEKQIIAIGINQFIEDPETTMAKILGLNPNIFYAICGPESSVILIDTRRWVLENELYKRDMSELIWYQ